MRLLDVLHKANILIILCRYTPRIPKRVKQLNNNKNNNNINNNRTKHNNNRCWFNRYNNNNSNNMAEEECRGRAYKCHANLEQLALAAASRVIQTGIESYGDDDGGGYRR